MPRKVWLARWRSFATLPVGSPVTSGFWRQGCISSMPRGCLCVAFLQRDNLHLKSHINKRVIWLRTKVSDDSGNFSKKKPPSFRLPDALKHRLHHLHSRLRSRLTASLSRAFSAGSWPKDPQPSLASCRPVNDGYQSPSWQPQLLHNPGGFMFVVDGNCGVAKFIEIMAECRRVPTVSYRPREFCPFPDR